MRVLIFLMLRDHWRPSGYRPRHELCRVAFLDRARIRWSTHTFLHVHLRCNVQLNADTLLTHSVLRSPGASQHTHKLHVNQIVVAYYLFHCNILIKLLFQDVVNIDNNFYSFTKIVWTNTHSLLWWIRLSTSPYRRGNRRWREIASHCQDSCLFVYFEELLSYIVTSDYLVRYGIL